MPRSPVQKEHVQFIEWVIEFVQEDLDAWTPGKLDDTRKIYLPDFLEYAPDVDRKLSDDMEKRALNLKPTQRDLRLGMLEFADVVRPKRKECPEIAVRNAQGILRKALNDLVGGHHASLFDEGHYSVHIWPESGQSFSLIPSYFANTSAQALAALGRILAESRITPEQIRRCPQCNRIFYMARKPRSDQKYFFCSSRCQVYYYRSHPEQREREKKKPAKKATARPRSRASS